MEVGLFVMKLQFQPALENATESQSSTSANFEINQDIHAVISGFDAHVGYYFDHCEREGLPFVTLYEVAAEGIRSLCIHSVGEGRMNRSLTVTSSSPFSDSSHLVTPKIL